MGDTIDIQPKPERNYCCVFRIGNVEDIIFDHSLNGYKNITCTIADTIQQNLQVNIYSREVLDKMYYYCYLNIVQLASFRDQVYNYRGRGVIVLYGIQSYYPPLPKYIIGEQDVVLVNLLLSAVIQLNRHIPTVRPVRRLRHVNGDLELYYSSCT